MSAPLWAWELAGAFWENAGESESFPRDLRRPIARALPLSLIYLPGLRVSAIDDWLRRQGIPCGLAVPDRPLRACLVAHGSHGAIFLDGSDPNDEQRFSLAHELAHFLHDYWDPRRQAADRYGSQVLEVFDGVRAAEPEERVHALLALVPIGFQVHLMDRAPDGSIPIEAIDDSERSADRLALELLVPYDAVSADLALLPITERAGGAVALLTERYGLPGSIARQYARLLTPPEPASFVRRLWSMPRTGG